MFNSLLNDTVDGRIPAQPLQDFGPSACFNFLTVVAPMLTREEEGSKKTVHEVVQDFVHQQYKLHIIYIIYIAIFLKCFMKTIWN